MFRTIVIIISCISVACLVLSLQIRGHCVADLDPLGITKVRHADTEEEARSKLLTTYRYHTIYNIGKACGRSTRHRCVMACTIPLLACRGLSTVNS